MSTVEELRDELASYRHKDTSIAWAGSLYGTFSCDADRFRQLLEAAPDEHLITPGLAVMFTDGSWIDWETDDFGENGSWQTKRALERGERPLTVIATEDGTEIDEANGLYDSADQDEDDEEAAS